MKLTFVGNGVMAKAMIKPLLKNGYEIEVFGRDMEKLKILKKSFKDKIEIHEYEKAFNIAGKNIILCIKPYVLNKISCFFSGEANLLISILAKTTMDDLKNNFKSKKYIQAMPNIAANYGKSMTTLTGDISEKEKAEKILSSIGKTLWVESQKEFEIASILAGSGPAFLALVSEALIDGAVKEGLKRDDATVLTQGLFDGFAELLKNYSHPALIKDAVMSPGGITAYGYAKLEEGKVRDSFIKIFQKN